MTRWFLSLLLLSALVPFARAEDAGDYGPDWPVCQNLNEDPKTEIAACTRLIEAGGLTAQHLSWAYNDRATAWLDLRRPEPAFADFQKSIEVDSTNYVPYYNLAGLYNRAGRFKEALDLFDRAVALNPAIPEAFCNRGAALQQLGRFDEAIESFQRELARAPNNDCALYRLTELARDTHREELALAALDRALAQNPQDSESYHRRGIIHRDLGEADLALKDYGEAIRLDPGEAGAMHDRAQVYRDRAQFPEALADVSHAISIAPREPKNYYLRAQLYFLTGDYKQATTDCDRYRSIVPQQTYCTALSWRIAMMAGDFNAAVGYADAMIGANAVQYILFRGVARYANGDLMKAAADFAGYTEAAPGDPYGWLWLYLADRRLGRDDVPKLKEMAARRDAWPAIIIRHIAGLASAEDVLASTDVPDPKLKTLRLAEANYYLGELAALSGDAARAEALFRSSIAAGRAEFESAKSVPVYKSDDDLELALANAALHSKGL